jgi:hypothetical protein
MDGQDGILAIVLAAEHLLDLGGLDLLVERVERLGELGVDRLPRVGPFEQDGEVVAPLLERGEQIAILLEPSATLQDLLRLGLILPEVGCGGARFEARQLLVGSSGFKDSSGGLRHAC